MASTYATNWTSNYNLINHPYFWNNNRLNISANWYNNNASNTWNGDWNTSLNITVKGRSSFKAHCMFQNGALFCAANRSLSAQDVNASIG